MNAHRLDAATAARLAALPLACLRREYPNHIVHLLHSDADVGPPRRLTPAFCGCFDWHSAVHAHWCLVRLLRNSSRLAPRVENEVAEQLHHNQNAVAERLHYNERPDADWIPAARSVLAENLTEENLRAEVRYLSAPGRQGFERPYGLAWLLQLVAELREWNDADARRWLSCLEPLERVVRRHWLDWLPKLPFPIRSGEHSQTAFAMGLALDAARVAGDSLFETLLVDKTLAFHRGDRNGPLEYEPSGHDFFSPCLAEADLLRRVLEPEDFATWLNGFLPGIPAEGNADWLPPVVSPDPSEGKLSHLDGLNLSRAWMLEGIAAGLPQDDSRRASLLAAAEAHAASGLASVTSDHYAGAHWLASFAAYLLTERGIGED